MSTSPTPTIRFPLRSMSDRRTAERFGAELPVHVDGHRGRTHDLSTTGLSFETDQAYQPGQRVEVIIDYLLDGHSYPLRCEAEVVRVEPSREGFTVGARLCTRFGP